MPADGLLDDIEYPTTNFAYPLVGFSYFLWYTCYGNLNVFNGMYRAADIFTAPAATFDNLWRSNGSVRPQGAFRDAIRTLLLIDTRTRIRAGVRAPSATFVGCSTGA